ncbi:MAG: AAA domain-containing protein [Parcubacteria group bacterium]
MKTEFLFHRVVVIADGPNVFSEHLGKRQIPFTTMETIPGYADSPDLIVVINKGLHTAESLKGRFPNAQVVRCQGGNKNFAPRIEIIYGVDDHDVLWFSSWDDYIRLIGQQLPRQQRVLVPDRGTLYKRAMAVQGCPDTREDLRTLSDTMLRMSEVYLTWYLQWLEEVDKMFFACKFRVSRNRRAVRRLTLRNDEKFIHRGTPIFQEETSVSFFGFDAKERLAMVISVGDEEIVVSFATPLTRSEAQGLMSFKRNVDQDIPMAQRELCWKVLSRQSEKPSPLGVITGEIINHDDDDERWLADFDLSGENARRIGQDESQATALATVTDRRWISLIHGPAGTGKTFLTSLAIQQLHRQARVILLVSHSNQGLDNLLDFVAKCVRPEVIFRLGNNPRNVSKSAGKFHRTEKYGGFPQSASAEEADSIARLLLQNGNIVLACTMTSFLIDHTMAILRQQGFRADVVIVDEASRGFLF